MAETKPDPNQIDASPTKDFFIEMLIRDVPLNRAIIDLVDNSVDAARSFRTGNDYTGLHVVIEVKPTYFRITDNCGGISVVTAREYAFRFGRPKSAPFTSGSIGQFGVGLKRTFFKLGKRLFVESATSGSRFTVDIDLDEWKTRRSKDGSEDWHFEFKTLNEPIVVAPEQQGTIIQIEKLHQSVAESFGEDSFVKRVWQEIASAHTISMSQGLSIILNDVPLRPDPLNLLNSAVIQPAHIDLTFDTFGPKPVKVRLYAGVSERSKDEGGWYIFCNGRMVLRADQTNTSVWGEGDRVPKYHSDFARFRGLAYFESSDPGLLPWTTTKTGVDLDSPIYRAARQQMIEITRPVLEFLRKVATEKQNHDLGDSPETPFAKAVDSAGAVGIDAVKLQPTFVSPPPPPRPTTPPWSRIQYSKPAEEVARAKKLLGVYTFTDVGEKTFEYYMDSEGGKK